MRRRVHRGLGDLVPGKRLLGNYRFLPIFFLLGAGLEYTMIHLTAGTTNFYKTYRKRRVEELSAAYVAQEEKRAIRRALTPELDQILAED